MTEDDLIWQNRDEMPFPTNPLQKIKEVLTTTSRDCSEDKMLAFLYAITVGWSDDAYSELKKLHNWSDKDIMLQKEWHENYNKLWNLFVLDQKKD